MDALRTLDVVVLIAEDPHALARFYTERLGLTLLRDRGTWIELGIGDTVLAIRPPEIPYDPPGSLRRGAGVHLAFRVAPDAVDRWHGRLREQGVEIVAAPDDRAYGHRTMFFEDPEGNLLEIYAEISGAG